MPATQKPTQPPRSASAARAKGEADAQKLEHLAQTLEAAQRDLSAIGGSVGKGVKDLRRDVATLLKDARRDLTKMRRAVQRDLDRLQKDLGAAGAAKPGSARRSAPTTRARRRQNAH